MYSEALDTVLKKNVRAETTFSLITELVHRDGLRSALSGRDDVMLQPILRLLSQYIADPTFGELACDVALLVIEMYSSVLGQSPLVDSLLSRLRIKVGEELTFQRELISIQGMVDMLMATSMLGSGNEYE